MNRVEPQPWWPESWRTSYEYDRVEVYGARDRPGLTNLYRHRMTAVLRMVQSVARPPARILDVAAGQGNLTLALAERGYNVTWNDIREDLVGYVQLKHDKGNVTYLPGDFFSVAVDAPFDVVVLAEVIEHVAHPDEMLCRAASLVRKGGHVVVTTPNGGYLRNALPRWSDCPDPSVYEAMQFKPNDDGHIFLLHPEEFPILSQQAGLEVEGIRLFNAPLTIGHMKTEPLLRVLPQFCVDGLELLTYHIPYLIRRRLCFSMAVLLKRT